MSRVKLFVIVGPEEISYLSSVSSFGMGQALTDSFLPEPWRETHEVAATKGHGERWYLRLREKAA